MLAKIKASFLLIQFSSVSDIDVGDIDVGDGCWRQVRDVGYRFNTLEKSPA